MQMVEYTPESRREQVKSTAGGEALVRTDEMVAATVHAGDLWLGRVAIKAPRGLEGPDDFSRQP